MKAYSLQERTDMILVIDVQCNVSSQVNYTIYAYWGVNIRELHVCLWKPWASLKDGFESGSLLKGQYQLFGSKITRNPHSDETLSLSLPEPSIDLGTPPRLYYPLVIFLLRTDDQEIHPDETVSVFVILHLENNTIVYLYYTTGNPPGYDDSSQISLALAEPVQGGPGRTLVCPTGGDSGMWNVSGEQLCVVCQYFPLSRALLPCSTYFTNFLYDFRHTCICASCFDKLDRCPMCRGPIKSYFCIRGEEYMPLPNAKSSVNSSLQSPVCNWLDALNDRLIDFLGFQR
ncbi:cell growth regulator with ring finger domain protein 1 [Holotrichia oblita]|uniref:Cell growth regulator with ring finger domain protein 1 n=1 Tax=Holotrichia oblita TaxID=644536 RepID=A0ACB9SIA4_HOLOL|nr:cell growth regulator with ring finger domain protein 1 [Holotrichia oblita]